MRLEACFIFPGECFGSVILRHCRLIIYVNPVCGLWMMLTALSVCEAPVYLDCTKFLILAFVHSSGTRTLKLSFGKYLLAAYLPAFDLPYTSDFNWSCLVSYQYMLVRNIVIWAHVHCLIFYIIYTMFLVFRRMLRIEGGRRPKGKIISTCCFATFTDSSEFCLRTHIFLKKRSLNGRRSCWFGFAKYG